MSIIISICILKYDVFSYSTKYHYLVIYTIDFSTTLLAEEKCSGGGGQRFCSSKNDCFTYGESVRSKG